MSQEAEVERLAIEILLQLEYLLQSVEAAKLREYGMKLQRYLVKAQNALKLFEEVSNAKST